MLLRPPSSRTRRCWLYKYVQAVKEMSRNPAEGMRPRNTSDRTAPPASIQEAPWPESEPIIFWQTRCPSTHQHWKEKHHFPQSGFVCERESEREQAAEQKGIEGMALHPNWKEPVATAQVKFQLYDIMGFF